jgi:hypothetical protein
MDIDHVYEPLKTRIDTLAAGIGSIQARLRGDMAGLSHRHSSSPFLYVCTLISLFVTVSERRLMVIALSKYGRSCSG